MPFTTPMLAGARVRPSKRSGTELVVPNPSGNGGVYVVLWPGVRELCNPTVHDRRLIERISGFRLIDPAAVRDAGLAVALDGYAGRDAAAAAEAARDSDDSHRLLAQFRLLAELIEQVLPAGRRATVLAEKTADFDRRAGFVLQRIAPSFGRPVAHLAVGLTTIATAFAPVGVGWDDSAARIPRLIVRLKEAQTTLSEWLAADPEHDIGGLGRAVIAMMEVASTGSQAVLTLTRHSLADPAALLKRWIAAPNDVERLASRCDWLLDGWERVCLLWKMANSPASRRAALLEMAQLLPVLPREAMDWLPVSIPREAMDPDYRVISRNDAWRSGGAAVAQIERNEALRAMSI